MRKILYVCILAAMFFAPVRKLDVAHLEPVEVVYVAKDGESMIIQTDTGAQGEGATAIQAFQDLKNNTSGVVYLDTAEYLIVGAEDAEAIRQMRSLLKNSVKLCRAEDPDLEIAASFLETHGNLPALKDWEDGMPLPAWTQELRKEKSQED